MSCAAVNYITSGALNGEDFSVDYLEGFWLLL
jgi:hypothetical protein